MHSLKEPKVHFVQHFQLTFVNPIQNQLCFNKWKQTLLVVKLGPRAQKTFLYCIISK